MPECSKVRYANQWTALAAMRAITRNRRVGKIIPRGVYLCGTCKAWHLTSKRGIQSPPWEKPRAV